MALWGFDTAVINYREEPVLAAREVIVEGILAAASFSLELSGNILVFDCQNFGEFDIVF